MSLTGKTLRLQMHQLPPLSEPDEGRYIDPDRHDGVCVAVHIDSQGELDVAGLLTVNTSGIHGFHDGRQIHKRHVDWKARHLRK